MSMRSQRVLPTMSDYSQPTLHAAVNASGQTLVAGMAVRVLGVIDDPELGLVARIDLPVSDNDTEAFFVRNAGVVPPGEYCQIDRTMPAFCLVTIPGITSLNYLGFVGSLVGVKAGQTVLDGRYVGFRILRIDKPVGGEITTATVAPMLTTQTGFVRVTGPKNGEGLYPAVLVRWNPVTLGWEDGPVVWYSDPNNP